MTINYTINMTSLRWYLMQLEYSQWALKQHIECSLKNWTTLMLSSLGVYSHDYHHQTRCVCDRSAAPTRLRDSIVTQTVVALRPRRFAPNIVFFELPCSVHRLSTIIKKYIMLPIR